MKAHPTDADDMVWTCESRSESGKLWTVDLAHWHCNCPHFQIRVAADNRDDIARGGSGLGVCAHLSRVAYLYGWKKLMEARVRALEQEEADYQRGP